MEKQKLLKAEINDLQNKLAFQRNYIHNLEETCQDLEKKVKELSKSVDVSCGFTFYLDDLILFFFFSGNINRSL